MDENNDKKKKKNNGLTIKVNVGGQYLVEKEKKDADS